MSNHNLTENNSHPLIKIVAIVASAGGVKALAQVVSDLPSDYSGTIVVVQHLSRHFPSHLANILDSRSPLRVKRAEAEEKLARGVVYVAPPNYHLLVNNRGLLQLTQSELVNFVRPSGDVLLKSVAESFGKKAIAVILTGTGKDGTAGVKAIHERGGMVIVQSEDTAEFPSMPNSAMQTGIVDIALPLNEIAPTLVSLIAGDNNE